MKKIRGFEKITEEQFNEDCGELNYEDIKSPERGTSRSAGYDIFAIKDIELESGKEMLIPTGVKAYMGCDEVLEIYPRSGLGFKFYTRLANTVGIIDSDYYNNSKNEGHIWVKLRNESDESIKIEKGDAFVQSIFKKYLLADNDDFEGDKREGGFGSTDN